MATSIPPHNLGEICDALIRVIDEPDVSIDELLEIVPGPRLPHRRHHLRPSAASAAATTPAAARSSSAPAPRSKSTASDRYRIVVTEIPYQQARDRVEERIADAGQRRQDHGHLGDPQRERPEGAGPARDRAEARRRPGRRAEPALPVLAAAGHVLAHLPGAGRRQAAGAVRSRRCWRSSSATA